MATLAINNTTLIVKYLYDNNGTWFYQRTVPKDLQYRLGLKKITEKIHPSKGNPAIQAQRIAKGHTQLFENLRADPDLVVPPQKLGAIALLA